MNIRSFAGRFILLSKLLKVEAAYYGEFDHLVPIQSDHLIPIYSDHLIPV